MSMSPKKGWKPKPNLHGAEAPTTLASNADFRRETPSNSLYDRIGPQAPPRRSLLERMELENPPDVTMGGDQDSTCSGAMPKTLSFMDRLGTHGDRADAYRPRKSGFDNSAAAPATTPDQNGSSTSEKRPPRPLKTRIGRALNSAVLQNSKLRDPNGIVDLQSLEAKINAMITPDNIESFERKLQRIGEQMADAPIPTSRVTTEQVLNGFENAWSIRGEENSLFLKPSVASTSSLPTPPPSELESMNKPPPKGFRSMLGQDTPPTPRTSWKGKEKATDTDDARERYSNYMQNGGSPRPGRRTPSPTSLRGRNYRDEFPPYRSTSRSRIRSPRPLRRSRSRDSTRHGSGYSPSRNGYRSRTPPRRDTSRTQSFDNRRPSASPPRSANSNGFRPSRKSRSRSRSRHRDLPRSHRSPSPAFNSQYNRQSPSPTRKRKYSDRSPPPPRHRSPPTWTDSRGPGRGPPSTSSVGHGEEEPNGTSQKLVSPFHPKPRREWVPETSPAPPPSRPANPCDKVPGLWLVKVGAETSRVLEGTFVIEPGFAAIYDLTIPRPPSALANSKICVSLLCLSTEAVHELYTKLSGSGSSPENMATAVAELETSWPQDGTLFLDINHEADFGRTWLPYDLDPASPIDVTNYIQPGPNVIRFIQLAGMVQRTFILYASRPKPVEEDPFSSFDDLQQTDNKLLNFEATVTIS